MRYGEWMLCDDSRDIIGCCCVEVARCGCVDQEQRAWALDMDGDGDVEAESGVECLGCGATWTCYDDGEEMD